MGDGYLTLLLHAHLPYVRHPEHEDFLEENWLFEAITECYLPLLTLLDRMDRNRETPCLALSLSPTLTAMLRDPFLQSRYLDHVHRLVALAEMELRRTRKDAVFQPLARMYHALFQDAIRSFDETYHRDLVGAFARLQEEGMIEIMTCAATHGYLPLLRTEPEAVRAQLLVGQQSYRDCFGRDAHGVWLPECGYYPGLESVVKASGYRYFVVESHGLLHADAQPQYGLFSPVACPNGVAVFGRDPESSKQVWCGDYGYPGDYQYRDFYRDIGFDLDADALEPFLRDPHARLFTGIKYYRITGGDGPKEPYVSQPARQRAEEHAAHFLAQRREQLRAASAGMPRPAHVTAPYDAELFGHWWFEGPVFIEALLRGAGKPGAGVELLTPSVYLDRYPVLDRVTPSASSWGWEGYNDCWLSGDNDWTYPLLHAAARRMSTMARIHHDEAAASPRSRALNQAARSLLLAQASDWTFIMKTKTSVEYAQQRVRDHVARFHVLCDQAASDAVRPDRLEALEALDPIFPFLDFRIFAPPDHRQPTT